MIHKGKWNRIWGSEISEGLTFGLHDMLRVYKQFHDPCDGRRQTLSVDMAEEKAKEESLICSSSSDSDRQEGKGNE